MNLKRLAVVCGLVSATPAFAITDFFSDGGRPVTYNDLVGKKICWSPGNRGWVFFGADGYASDERGDHNPWVIVEPGVIRFGRKNYRQYRVLPNGQFHQYKYCLLCGDHDIDIWGTQCN